MPAATASPTDRKQLRVGVSYGFLGGHGTGRRFGRLLRQAGFLPTQNLDEADIIVAHSAGTWHIPESSRPQLIIYIGMPLPRDTAPRRTYLEANHKNIMAFVRNKHFKSGIGMALHSLQYALVQPRRNLRIIRAVGKTDPVIKTGCQHIFIANRDDPWPQAEKLQHYLQTHDWTFISFTGSHDDIWEHPERYIAIIQRYARLLAEANPR